MKNLIIKIRNSILRLVYKGILKRILFLIDPEKIHDTAIRAGKFWGFCRCTRFITRLFFSYSNKALEQDIRGIKFPNPIGLAAGFDKSCELTDVLPCVGFGFAECGSVTGEPCEGNPRPRLWRLPKSKSLVVYYGLKNNGCEEISKRLKKKSFKIPIGISIAKTNSKDTIETNAGIKDYVKAYNHLKDIGQFMTINISCPNAYGGEPFTDSKRLDKLLTEIDKTKKTKPVFIKMSPDLTIRELDEIIELARKHKIDGFICTNLTKNRDNKKIINGDVPDKGGLSGKVVEDLANYMIFYIYKKTKGEFVIMGCGGVFSAEDAYKKIKLGASLIQLITGMIFEGPQVISDINLGLVKLLKKDGYNNISEAVGSSLR